MKNQMKQHKTLQLETKSFLKELFLLNKTQNPNKVTAGGEQKIIQGNQGEEKDNKTRKHLGTHSQKVKDPTEEFFLKKKGTQRSSLGFHPHNLNLLLTSTICDIRIGNRMFKNLKVIIIRNGETSILMHI